MATRQRPVGVTTTLPRQSALPAHEDFRPKSERKEEAAATVIVIHLPGVCVFCFLFFFLFFFSSSMNIFI
jgi:quinol-cytochrome oxidoreductase complex cytochrome b subunit